MHSGRKIAKRRSTSADERCIIYMIHVWFCIIWILDKILPGTAFFCSVLIDKKLKLLYKYINSESLFFIILFKERKNYTNNLKLIKSIFGAFIDIVDFPRHSNEQTLNTCSICLYTAAIGEQWNARLENYVNYLIDICPYASLECQRSMKTSGMDDSRRYFITACKSDRCVSGLQVVLRKILQLNVTD